MLCGHYTEGEQVRLLACEIYPIPYEYCIERAFDCVKWSTEILIPWLEKANKYGWSIVKIHGHRAEWPWFSAVDTLSDDQLFSSLPGWVDADVPHASVILLSDCRLFGRWSMGSLPAEPLSQIAVLGDTIDYFEPVDFDRPQADAPLPAFTQRHAQIFGHNTTARLRKLSAAVVGCSGTGSPIIEQLARLGIGRLVLIDPDLVEEKNLNRILHTTMADVQNHRYKVDVLAEAVRKIGIGTQVEELPLSLFTRESIHAIAGCDVVFGCMDSVEGRFVLNKLATFYLLPYFDLGVKLEADDDGDISQVSGAVHYLQPGRSSLVSRNVFSMKDVEAEALRRRNPQDYEQRRKEGYIRGVQEDRPAVISVNMMVASMGVNDFLARLHDYRTDGNAKFASWRVSLSHGCFYPESEGITCNILKRHVGRGDIEPPLDYPEMS